ncbi:MAG: hypothetical protein CK429_35525 [Mycobacterium sp.]|uniref:PE family protein n=1 Tax=Mycobacterium sp. MS3 TaxID=3391378 RepID=UPI000CBD91E8|nr:MAG: hypothetical protein CK429_35525 [Mycobacterium sp.]
MPMLKVVPAIVSAASENLASLGADLRAATAAAAHRTTAIAAPAADEVSEAITTFLGTQAKDFHAVSAKAAVFHDQFVKLLHGGVAQYVATEAANSEQILAHAVNAPAQALLSHPLMAAGQGSGAAAAIAIPTQTFFSLPLGPFEVYAQASAAFGTDIGLRLNTPLGSVTLFSEGVSFSANIDSFGWKYHFGNPLLYFGTLYSSGQTGYILNGLTFTWPGPPLLGGILPNVSYTPWSGPPLLYDVLPTSADQPIYF